MLLLISTADGVSGTHGALILTKFGATVVVSGRQEVGFSLADTDSAVDH